MKDGSIILGKQSQKVYYAQFKDVNVYDFSNILEIKPIEEQHVKKENKMSKFGVFHIFDVDGGFGDAIGQQELICIFDTEEQANEFKTKFEKPHVYDRPYQALECGKLEVKELPTSYDEKDFWWLSEEYEEDEEDDEE